MTGKYTSVERWRDDINAILDGAGSAAEYFRSEVEPYRAIIRLSHALDDRSKEALGLALLQLVDETVPAERNSSRLYHLIQSIGGVKPASGLETIEKLLRDGTFRRLSCEPVNLHTLLISMAGEYILRPSLREWIYQDCSDSNSFDQRRIGFAVLAAQQFSTEAASLLESAIELASETFQQKQLAMELRALSHPHADLYKWLRALRASSDETDSSRSSLLRKTQALLAKYFFPADVELTRLAKPWEILLAAEASADKKFSTSELRAIGLTHRSVGLEPATGTLRLLYEHHPWQVLPVQPTNYDSWREADSNSNANENHYLLTRGYGDSVVFNAEHDNALLALFRQGEGNSIDADELRATSPPPGADHKALVWTGWVQ